MIAHAWIDVGVFNEAFGWALSKKGKYRGEVDQAMLAAGSSSSRMAWAWASTAVGSGAIRRPTIRGITCRCWQGSLEPCTTVRPSRTGRCRPRTRAAQAERWWRPADPDRRAHDGLQAVKAACAEANSVPASPPRRDPQHPGAAAATSSIRADRDPGLPSSQDHAARRLRSVRQPQLYAVKQTSAAQK